MENKTTDNLTNAIQNAQFIPNKPESTDSWALTSEQLQLMQSHHEQIEQAYADDDDDYFAQMMNSPDFLQRFGSMGWDEAYDRYEVWLENNTLVKNHSWDIYD